MFVRYLICAISILFSLHAEDIDYSDPALDFCYETRANIPSSFGKQLPLLEDKQFTILPSTLSFPLPKKKWLFAVYMAARNELHPFAKMNIKQMAAIGSNEYMHIVINIDEPGNHGTQRYLIEKGNLILLKHEQQRDSGDGDNLVDFCSFALTHFPADHRALILWNHGTGCSIDPHLGTHARPRRAEDTIPYKGICFDDVFRSYLRYHTLNDALATVQKEIMQGGKWDIIGFDACHMADLATAGLTKKYAHIQIGSEEVEMGSGWNYRMVLAPFLLQGLNPLAFAEHIVTVYERAYQYFPSDYTLSAIDLSVIDALEKNVHDVSLLLVDCLTKQRGQIVKDTVQISGSHHLCTSFDEPSYKDLGHFYKNLLANSDLFEFANPAAGKVLMTQLQTKLKEGLELIDTAVLANVVCKKHNQALGISIYLPEARIHSSFGKTLFAMHNAWHTFIKTYLTP